MEHWNNKEYYFFDKLSILEGSSLLYHLSELHKLKVKVL